MRTGRSQVGGSHALPIDAPSFDRPAKPAARPDTARARLPAPRPAAP